MVGTASTSGNPGDELARRVRVLLVARPNVREVRMFGGLSFLVDDHLAVAAGGTGDLLVRTHPADYDRLLDRGAVPARMGADRTMGRGWLTVPSDLLRDDSKLADWIETGIRASAASGKPVAG